MFYRFWEPPGMVEWVGLTFPDKLLQEKSKSLFCKQAEQRKSRPPPAFCISEYQRTCLLYTSPSPRD